MLSIVIINLFIKYLKNKMSIKLALNLININTYFNKL